MQLNRAGGWGNHGQTTKCKHRYTKMFKGNWEQGNWPTTCVVRSGKWLWKSLQLGTGKLANHLGSKIGQVAGEIMVGQLTVIGTQKYLKATGKGETGQPPIQPPMHSNRASGWGNHCQTTNCVLSIGTRKYLKAIGNGETGQPLVQSKRAGG
ncbi:unnamed protein product [Prunus brigantina]